MKRTRRESIALRHKRVRKNVSGSADKPRLAFFRSLRYLYCQVVDDTTGRTLVAATTLEGAFEKHGADKERQTAKTIVDAQKLGEAIAQRAQEKGIKNVVFDRGGFKYHGRVKAFADAAREKGLEF